MNDQKPEEMSLEELKERAIIEETLWDAGEGQLNYQINIKDKKDNVMSLGYFIDLVAAAATKESAGRIAELETQIRELITSCLDQGHVIREQSSELQRTRTKKDYNHLKLKKKYKRMLTYLETLFPFAQALEPGAAERYFSDDSKFNEDGGLKG